MTFHLDLDLFDYAPEAFMVKVQTFPGMLLPPTGFLTDFTVDIYCHHVVEPSCMNRHQGAYGGYIMLSLQAERNWPGRLLGLRNT